MIDNRDRLARSPDHEVVLDCLEAGVSAARPAAVIDHTVRQDGTVLRVNGPGRRPAATVDLAEYESVVVLGGGKPAAGMAAAIERRLGDRVDGGLVVTETTVPTDRVTVREGDHPVPTDRNVAATRELLEVAETADEGTVVIATLAGGASALLTAPAGDLTRSDLATTTEALLESGAAIDEINAVRKHCSAIKGGQLARAAAPASVITAALSDVVGDDLSVIGSGPTVPDPSTYTVALDVLDEYDVEVPTRVHSHLVAGRDGDRPETPKSGDPVFDACQARVIGNGYTALAAARDVVPDGYDIAVLSSRFEGEAVDLADPHVAIAGEVAATGDPVSPPAVLLSGGEATVTVTGDGEGGPNQEFALAAGLELPSIPEVPDDRRVVVGAIDTDGRDGASAAAGGLIDTDTIADVSTAEAALSRNDALPFLSKRDALVRTGPTGTNVNDLRVFLVNERR